MLGEGEGEKVKVGGGFVTAPLIGPSSKVGHDVWQSWEPETGACFGEIWSYGAKSVDIIRPVSTNRIF